LAGLLAPYVMGSVVETAATPLNGFNTGFMICGVAARRRAHVLGVERVLEREHDAVQYKYNAYASWGLENRTTPGSFEDFARDLFRSPGER